MSETEHLRWREKIAFKEAGWADFKRSILLTRSREKRPADEPCDRV